MVRKVTLDTLDIEENAASLSFQGIMPATTKETEEPTKKIFLSWRNLLLSGAIFVLLVAGGLSYWIHQTKNPVQSAKTPIAYDARYNMLSSVNDFVVPVMDETGEERALVCDVTVELTDKQYQDNIKINIVDIRNVIFNAIKKRTVPILLQSQERTVLKEEISAELIKYLGKYSIKQIYFTKFMVL